MAVTRTSALAPTDKVITRSTAGLFPRCRFHQLHPSLSLRNPSKVCLIMHTSFCDSLSYTKHLSPHVILLFYFYMKPNIIQPLPSVNVRKLLVSSLTITGSVTPIHRTRTGIRIAPPLPDSDITLPLPSPIQREIAQIIINQQLIFSLEDNE